MKRHFKAWSAAALFTLACLSAPSLAADKLDTEANAPEMIVEKSNGEDRIKGAPVATDDVEVFTRTSTDTTQQSSCNLPNATWIGPRGAFHMNGTSGRGIYEYNNRRWHTTWTFTDCDPVDDKSGWTYKEDGFDFYMFFSQRASSNGKYQLMYSEDNQNFYHYDWAI